MMLGGRAAGRMHEDRHDEMHRDGAAAQPQVPSSRSRVRSFTQLVGLFAARALWHSKAPTLAVLGCVSGIRCAPVAWTRTARANSVMDFLRNTWPQARGTDLVDADLGPVKALETRTTAAVVS